MRVDTAFSEVKMFATGLSKDTSKYETPFLEIYLHYLKYFENAPLVQDVKYVPHDLQHSVRVLESFCDMVDPNATKEFDSRTWFIVGVSIYLHDIAMQFKPEDRKKHGMDGASFIQEQADLQTTPIHTLDQDDIYCIKKIVNAHTNSPGLSTEKVFQTIESAYPPGKDSIMLKQLAAMIRIADELDISRDRIKKYDRFDYGIEISIDENQINDESFVHWEKCELFNRPQIVQDNSRRDYNIHLVPIDETVKNRIDIYGYRITCLLLAIVINKVSKSLNEMKAYGDISKNGYCKDLSAVLMVTNPPNLELESAYFELSVESIKEASIASEIKEYKFPKETAKRKKNLSRTSIDIKVVANKQAKKLQAQLKNINFIESGHYKVSSTHCVHDWINCKMLVHNRELSDLMIKCIVNDILSRSTLEENCALKLPDVVLGVDSTGFLLASKVAMTLCLPFTSYIPSRYNNEISEMDRNIFGEFTTKCSDIVLITDVVVFGEAVAQAIAAIKKIVSIENDCITIYTMFVRETNSKLDSELEGVHIKSLTKKLSTSLIEEKECLLRLQGRCVDTKKPLISDGGVLCDK
jgi:orotate phosphoribosyltransferase-like protein